MEMFKSATRVSMLTMIMALVGINAFALVVYPDTAFKETFTVFSNVIVAITSYFFGKSSGQQAKPVEPVEKPLDNFQV